MTARSSAKPLPVSAGAGSRTPRPGPRIVIAGGGAAGLCLAIALRHGLGTSATITLVEPSQASNEPDNRGWAVTAGSRRLLEAIGAWQAMASDAAPVTQISVTDSRTRDVVRPVFLNFDEPREANDPFAHIVLAGTMVSVLRETAQAAGVTLRNGSVTDFSSQPGAVTAKLDDGESLGCDLLVAADGSRSRLRDLAGIGFVRWDYPQSGIVASLTHERPHQGRAIEH
ncbi:MAG: FAD-dependent monooxygenase, partial [Bosea sp. (in: a-proteobacteria)]